MSAALAFYRCRCGIVSAQSSAPPASCARCPKCGTTLDNCPEMHMIPLAHEWQTFGVESPFGPVQITRCKWCAAPLIAETTT